MTYSIMLNNDHLEFLSTNMHACIIRNNIKRKISVLKIARLIIKNKRCKISLSRLNKS